MGPSVNVTFWRWIPLIVPAFCRDTTLNVTYYASSSTILFHCHHSVLTPLRVPLLKPSFCFNATWLSLSRLVDLGSSLVVTPPYNYHSVVSSPHHHQCSATCCSHTTAEGEITPALWASFNSGEETMEPRLNLGQLSLSSLVLTFVLGSPTSVSNKTREKLICGTDPMFPSWGKSGSGKKFICGCVNAEFLEWPLWPWKRLQGHLYANLI